MKLIYPVVTMIGRRVTDTPFGVAERGVATRFRCSQNGRNGVPPSRLRPRGRIARAA